MLYDLVLRGGELIDPGQNLRGTFDVAINGGIVAHVAKDIPPRDARQIMDVRGLIVTPGLIDLHCHVAEGVTRHSVNPDRAGVYQGVTTVVDGGSTGSHNFVGLRLHVLPKIVTSLYGFVNLSFYGEARMPEVRDMDDIDMDALIQILEANRDVVKGVKFRAVSPLLDTIGADALKLAKEAARSIGGSVMVHIGDRASSPNASAVTRKIIAGLEKGDIITHPYTPHPGGIFLKDGSLIPELKPAKERGVILDVARGAGNFGFEVTRHALALGIPPDTISTDITITNIAGPVFGLLETMSIFLNLGLSLEDVVAMSTMNPARALDMDNEIGSLKPGMRADVTVAGMAEGEFEFCDTPGDTLKGRVALFPITTIKGGKVIPAEPPAGSMGARARQVVGR